MSTANPIMSAAKAQSMAGADIAKQVETEQVINRQLEEKKKELAKQIEKDAALLQKEISGDANPNPIIVSLIIIGILAAIWFLYIMLVKKTLCGEWREVNAEGNATWILKQNRFTDELLITITDGKNTLDRGHGRISGNVFSYKGKVGVWNQSNVVIFIDGGGLQRVL